MNLAFSTKWAASMPKSIAGKPTNFVSKILLSLYESSKITVQQLEDLAPKDVSVSKAKRHTIRQDSKNRWAAEKNIHFIINNRTPQRFQFAPVISVVSTQSINIVRVPNVPAPYNYKTDNNITYQVVIDGKAIMVNKMHILAINDGFDNVEDFFSWFKAGLTDGVLIHWTDLKY